MTTIVKPIFARDFHELDTKSQTSVWKCAFKYFFQELTGTTYFPLKDPATYQDYRLLHLFVDEKKSSILSSCGFGQHKSGNGTMLRHVGPLSDVFAFKHKNALRMQNTYNSAEEIILEPKLRILKMGGNRNGVEKTVEIKVYGMKTITVSLNFVASEEIYTINNDQQRGFKDGQKVAIVTKLLASNNIDITARCEGEQSISEWALSDNVPIGYSFSKFAVDTNGRLTIPHKQK